jgi:tetratricopeptide (TPR) repeat protein
VEALANRGMALKALHRLPEAIASHRRAIALSPDQSDAHLGLAEALLQDGQLREGCGNMNGAGAARRRIGGISRSRAGTVAARPAAPCCRMPSRASAIRCNSAATCRWSPATLARCWKRRGRCCGRPVWLLNRHDSEWRWLLRRDDSPWYPSLRQFRQPAYSDWAGVVAAIAARLAQA